MTLTPVITRILEPEMRDRFNTGGFWDRLKTGELTAHVLDESVPKPESGEPPGTVSQMVSYRDSSDNEVARVHQYLRPDGTIGASGRPDPKRLLAGGILYRLEKKHNRKPQAPSPLGTATPVDE